MTTNQTHPTSQDGPTGAASSARRIGNWKGQVTSANGQPAVAGYLRRPGAAAYELFAMDVLRIEDGMIAEITACEDSVLEWFDLPSEIAAA